MKRLFIFIFVCCTGYAIVAAQEPSTVISFPATDFPTSAQGRPSIHATLLGIGSTHQLETYLSPLEYQGPQLHFMHETLRRTRHIDGRISVQTLWHGNFAYTKSPAENGRALSGDISFDAAWHYRLFGPLDESAAGKFRLLLGPQIGTTAGAIYNLRNGNNPV